MGIQKELERIPTKYGDLEKGTSGEYWTKQTKNVESIMQGLPPIIQKSILAVIPESLKPKFAELTFTTAPAHIKLAFSDPVVMTHEFLHDEFENKIKENSAWRGVFTDAWNLAKKEVPFETALIDETLRRRYFEWSPGTLNTERYAWFGATFGHAGLKNFPEVLQPFYQGVFK